MRYFKIEPEVAGGLGRNTDLDTSTHPPIVHKLNYEFAGWLGDALVVSFPCFVATVDLCEAIKRADLTGVRFAPVEITTSSEFRALHPKVKLPDFRWMQVYGRAGADDFGLLNKIRLVASQRALELLRRFGLAHADIGDYEG
jgi:hypothetical protein